MFTEHLIVAVLLLVYVGCNEMMNKIYTWGDNSAGQLSRPLNTKFRSISQAITTTELLQKSNITTLIGGTSYSMALSSNGDIFAWGINDSGQLGDNSTKTRYLPIMVNVTSIKFGKVVAIAAGYHTLALTSNSDVYAWGWNDFGQLGDGTYTTRLLPVPISKINLQNRTPVSIAIGTRHSVILTSSGEVFTFGFNMYGQLGIGYFATRVVAVQVNPIYFQNKNISHIAAGESFTLALTVENKLYGWGYNEHGQLGVGTTVHQFYPIEVNITALSNKTIVSVIAGQVHVVVLVSTGELFAWGYNQEGQLGIGTFQHMYLPVLVNTTGIITATTKIKSVSAGFHTVILTTDDQIFSFGHNVNGQLGDGTNYNRNLPVPLNKTLIGHNKILSVVAGAAHTLILTSNGEERIIFGHGANNYGELTGNIDYVTKLPVPVELDVFPNKVVSVVAGGLHSIVLLNNGSLFSWGSGQKGQLGDGSTDNAFSSFKIDTNSINGIIIGIDAGLEFTIALSSTGEMYSWGDNSFGQLGDGTNITKLLPSKVNMTPFNNEVIKLMSAGGAHVTVLTNSGRLFSWGYNAFGQLGDGTTTHRWNPAAIETAWVNKNSRIVAIDSGVSHTIALISNGDIFSWGSNARGQLGDGTTQGKSIPTQISPSCDDEDSTFKYHTVSAGYYHNLAIRNNTDIVLAWGSNDHGQLGRKTFLSLKSIPFIPNLVLDSLLVKISGGPEYTIALTEKGTLYSWGTNEFGNLGRRTNEMISYTPDKVTINENNNKVIAVSSGIKHVIALVTCNDGYYGRECNDFTCYGFNKSDTQACSGNGICKDLNQCTCNLGYFGSECQLWQCNNVLMNNNKTCSGHGGCILPDQCLCNVGYYGNICNITTCYGILSNNTKACYNNTGYGFCTGTNECRCIASFWQLLSTGDCNPTYGILTIVAAAVAVLICIVATIVPLVISYIRAKLKLKRQERAEIEMQSLLREGLINQSDQMNDTAEWLIKIEDLTFKERISEGSFGVVFSGLYKNSPVAIKMIKSERDIVEEFKNEVKILQSLRHPNIVLFMGVCMTESSKYIVTEFMNGKSLADAIHIEKQKLVHYKLHNSMTLTKKLALLIDVVLGMCYLHSHEPPLLHRDLKPSNILLNKNQSIAKVCDLGSAKAKNTGTMTGSIGTLLYMAPEVLSNQRTYSESCDVYSFGIIMYELFFEVLPYSKTNVFDENKEEDDGTFVSLFQLGHRVINGTRPLLPDVELSEREQKYVEIMKECWKHDFEQRPSFSEILTELQLLE